MIVVDANILVYLLTYNAAFPKHHHLAARLYRQDLFWLPPLWRHEFHNAMTMLVKQKMLSLEEAQKILKLALHFYTDFEREVDLLLALKRAHQYNLSGYDAQYVALAESLDLPLVTEDKKLIAAVPHIAQNMQSFLKT